LENSLSFFVTIQGLSRLIKLYLKGHFT